ncbi:sterol desaturase family protein [Sulfitobacter sp. JB4-11]|uniref:sterol desaturase family protein n=1 Tax=Sulfitobacter rhodophyticola TaxID=3238304 RepID=UPI003511AC2F
MDTMLEIFQTVLGGPHSRLWPIYLPGMIVLAFFIYRKEKQTGSFVRWLFPAKMYLHKSHMVDIQLFVVSRALNLLGLFQKIAIMSVVSAGIVGALGGHVSGDMDLSPWVIGLLLLLANDFATYWIHRVHHEHPTLWPFHAVHHSAEVMTPITVYRKHPIYDVFAALVKGVIVGTAQGLLLSLFVSEISIPLLLGVNAFYMIFNAFAANLRHSHVWLSFGRVMEHVFISPAQHQVHHSIELRHYNKNYGEVLAIWDWMFGTLYLCHQREEIAFGLGDADGNRIPQPHDSLRTALMVPIRQSLATLRRKPAPPAEPDPVTPAE